MIDYSLKPRLEEALSQGRIPALSREEALTLDNDYRTKVGEAVIGLAVKNLGDWLKNHGNPYSPNDKYNCFLENDSGEGCLQDLPEELQERFYLSLFSKVFSVSRERFFFSKKLNETPRVPFSAGEILERLIVRRGYSRDREVEKVTRECTEEAPWEDDFWGFRKKVRKFYEEEDNKKIKGLEPRARELFNDEFIKLENVNDLRGFRNIDDYRIYSNGNSTLFLGGYASSGIHLVHYNKLLMGNVGEVPKFLESVKNPEIDLNKVQKFVYCHAYLIPYLAISAALITTIVSLSASLPITRDLKKFVGASWIPAGLLSLIIGPKIKKRILNRQKQKLRQNPNFKFDEDAIKYLVEK